MLFTCPMIYGSWIPYSSISHRSSQSFVSFTEVFNLHGAVLCVVWGRDLTLLFSFCKIHFSLSYLLINNPSSAALWQWHWMHLRDIFFLSHSPLKVFCLKAYVFLFFFSLPFRKSIYPICMPSSFKEHTYFSRVVLMDPPLFSLFAHLIRI